MLSSTDMPRNSATFWKVRASPMPARWCAGRFEMSRGMALSKVFEHQTHHRGQTTVYIRLAGAKPPQEKLF